MNFLNEFTQFRINSWTAFKIANSHGSMCFSWILWKENVKKMIHIKRKTIKIGGEPSTTYIHKISTTPLSACNNRNCTCNAFPLVPQRISSFAANGIVDSFLHNPQALVLAPAFLRVLFLLALEILSSLNFYLL